MLSHLCHDREMRLGAALVFVLAGVISLSAHVAVELAAHVVKHALGGHYVTVWAGIFLIAGIWEVARPRRKAESSPVQEKLSSPSPQEAMEWLEPQ